ncbi:MAG: SulP family inorganic anion transporter [Gemmatimonadetes bacterium]|nr:SulP family inorganic anion transporter [Gemmatimonadota bacterium]
MTFYDTRNLRGDLSGGFVAGIIALPLALAFGVQSGLGAPAGLYGAIAIGILAAALGGTATQASGPTGPMTVVSASVVATTVAQVGSIDAALGIILLAFLLGGLFQIALGLLGVGKYIRYFPYPVISGFMSGVGLIIIALQVWPFLGSASPKSTLEVFTRIGEPLSQINTHAVILGGITVVVYYLFPRLTKAVPSVLVALLAGTGVSVVAGWNVPIIGDIPSGLPALQLGRILSAVPEHLSLVIGFAITLALLGSIDSLLTSVIADNVTKTKHDSRRELIGQGIGNVVAAIFGGIPGAGATKGTVVNINAGGTTRLSGVVHGLFLLAVLLGAGQFAAYIPLSVLAGLLIPVGVAIIDAKGFRHLRDVPRADSLVMLVVLGMTVFGNLIHAVGVGIVLASVLFMKKASDLAESRSSITSLEDTPWDDEAKLFENFKGRIFVKHLYGPLFFGFTARFQELYSSLPPGTRALIIRMERVPSIDQSGLYALEDAVLTLRVRGVVVLLIGVQTQPDDMLRRIRLVPDLIPEEGLFEGTDSCLAWLARELAVTPDVETT